MHSAAIALVLSVITLPALAGTWTVDDDGPADFTDIQPAIDAAAPGDVLLVKPGSYGIFQLDKALVLVGEPGARVLPLGNSWVQDIHSGQLVGIAGLEFTAALIVSSCSVPVVLDGVVGRFVNASNAKDVRVRGCNLRGVASAFGTRLEVSESVSNADPGTSGALSGMPGAGGLNCDASSIAHAYRSAFRGGDGGSASAGGGVGGDGGDGVRNSGELLLAGDATHLVQGGQGGQGPGGLGENGVGLGLLGQATARVSGVTVNGTMQAVGTTLEVPQPPDPALRILAPVGPAATVTFRLHAEPGSSAVLNLGRMPTVQVVPGSAEDHLVVVLRTFDMGIVDGSGVAGFNFTVPASATSGFVFFAQARVSMVDGSTRYTNSVPIVVR